MALTLREPPTHLAGPVLRGIWRALGCPRRTVNGQRSLTPVLVVAILLPARPLRISGRSVRVPMTALPVLVAKCTATSTLGPIDPAGRASRPTCGPLPCETTSRCSTATGPARRRQSPRWPAGSPRRRHPAPQQRVASQRDDEPHARPPGAIGVGGSKTSRLLGSATTASAGRDKGSDRWLRLHRRHLVARPPVPGPPSP